MNRASNVIVWLLLLKIKLNGKLVPIDPLSKP